MRDDRTISAGRTNERQHERPSSQIHDQTAPRRYIGPDRAHHDMNEDMSSLRHRSAARQPVHGMIGSTERNAGEYSQRSLVRKPAARSPAWKQTDAIPVVVNVLILIPPILVMGAWLRNVFAWPPRTLLDGVLITLVSFYRVCTAIQPIVDTSWRLPWSRPREKTSSPASIAGKLEDTPKVDIVITTCRECSEMIMDTVIAACRIEYPVDSYRVIVSDDGNDEELRTKVLALRNQKHDNLFYHSREKSAPVERNPKANNINSALQWIEKQTVCGRKAEWFAVLDCDMIPEAEFLRVLLGHATEDDRIGMAVPPQNHYNYPVNDPLYQSLNIQNALDDPARAAFGGTWCAGTGFLARRAAIDTIGGIPNSSLCEDILCGLMLNGKGWRVVYVDRPLQWGLAPDSIDAHIAQRRRWAVGNVQNAKILKFCWSKEVGKISPMQRLAGFSYCFVPNIRNIVQPMGFLLMPWALLSRPASFDYETLWWFILWSFIGQALYFCKVRVQMEVASPHALLQREFGQYWLRNIIWPSILIELLPEALGKIRRRFFLPFVSSGSIKSVLSERDPQMRVPLTRRLRTVILGRKYIPNTIMLVNAVVAFIVLLRADIDRYRASDRSASVIFLSSSLSPILTWECQLSFLIPILYAIFPPNVPQRREMMELDSRGIWRVRDEYKRELKDRWAVLEEMQAYLGLIWSGIALWLISYRPPGM